MFSVKQEESEVRLSQLKLEKEELPLSTIWVPVAPSPFFQWKPQELISFLRHTIYDGPTEYEQRILKHGLTCFGLLHCKDFELRYLAGNDDELKHLLRAQEYLFLCGRLDDIYATILQISKAYPFTGVHRPECIQDKTTMTSESNVSVKQEKKEAEMPLIKITLPVAPDRNNRWSTQQLIFFLKHVINESLAKYEQWILAKGMNGMDLSESPISMTFLRSGLTINDEDQKYLIRAQSYLGSCKQLQRCYRELLQISPATFSP